MMRHKISCLLFVVLIASIAHATAPVLFFSDIIYGPNTGWNNTATQGAAVTIWGKNFGTTQGSSFVTIGGAQATSYAEWDAIGPARGLERITFYIPTTAATGAQNISVTVGGVASNTLPFTVDNTTPIYYIDVNTGSNTNNGRTTSTAFKDIYKITPGTDGVHTCPAQCNPSGDGQYIVYVRGGSYTTKDPGVYFSHPGFFDILSNYGGPTKQKALVAYPGETPILVMDNAQAAFQMQDDLPGGGTCCGASYFTFAKLTVKKVSTCATWACSAMMTMYYADHFRIIANVIQDLIPPNQVYDGIIFVGDSSFTSIFGNYWNHNGFDSYDHGIYVKTQPAYTCCTTARPTVHTDIGWNEFNNGFASDNHGGQDIFVSHDSSPSPSSYPTDDTRIHHNYFHDGNSDFFYVGDNTPLNGNIYMWANIFKGGGVDGTIEFYCGGKDVYLYNNTFYSPQPINADWTGSYSSCAGGASALKEHFSNNIWQATSNSQVWIQADPGPITTFDHDIYFQPNGAQNYPASNGVTVTNPTNANPLLVNPPTDYHLQSTSPAIGKGANLFATMNGWQAGTLGGAIDFDGVPYPASGVWDDGALQFATGGGGGGPTPPNPPTGLTATVN